MGKSSARVRRLVWAQVLEALRAQGRFTVIDVQRLVPGVTLSGIRMVVRRWLDSGAIVPVGFRREGSSPRPFTVYVVSEQQKEGES